MEYARAPIAVIVVAHMGANAVFLPNAKSADRADMMDAIKSNQSRVGGGVTTPWYEWARAGALGRDTRTSHDSWWISTEQHRTTETSIKKSNMGLGETMYV